MKPFYLDNYVRVFGVEAASFPDGVQEAWQELHKRLPTRLNRNFYGISQGTKSGAIVYKACVEESFPGEAERLQCDCTVLPQGEYVGQLITDFMHQLPKIGETFRILLSREDYENDSVCVEHYLNETDLCA